MTDPLVLADLCRSAELLALSPGDPVSRAVGVMDARGASAVVLVSGNRPVGIFALRDVLNALARGDYAPHTPLGDLTPPDPPIAPARLSCLEGLALMAGRGDRHLVLVDDRGQLAGLIEASDFLRVLAGPPAVGDLPRGRDDVLRRNERPLCHAGTPAAERTGPLELGTKALRLLYCTLSILAEPAEDATAALARVVKLIPGAWQHPDHAVAEIRLEGAGYPPLRVATKGYRATGRMQRAFVRVGGEPRGLVSLAYLGPVPPGDSESFLPEEGDLIEAIAAEIGRFLGRVETERAARRSADEIVRLSRHDPLTGLPNQTELRTRLAAALEQARAGRRRLAVLVVDLDCFRDVVASHGHGAGDAVLKSIAASLAEDAEPEDVVARLVGDSFAVARIIDGGAEHALRAAIRVQALCNRPLDRAGLPGLSVTASLGIALFPGDAASVTGLLRNAESALHRAKESGRNGIACYRREMTEAARRRVRLETELRQALARDELRLHYQPIVETQTGALVAVEALLRWQHPRAGLIGPQDLPGFIQAVETSDLVHPVGRWAIERAVEQARAWRRPGGQPARLRVSVNVAGPQIAGGTLARDLRRVLVETGLDPALLEIEVLEGVLLRDPAQALSELNRVRDLGVAIALDDFGTGYSSLSYLKRFPVDYLKIDQTFIRHLPSDPGDAAIVRSTIAMSHSLGIRVVAEGVETQGQMDCLAHAGCDLVQGFLLGHPASAETIDRQLEAGSPLGRPTAVRETPCRNALILVSDPNLRGWVQEELAEQGWDLLPVASQEDAWALLASRKVDLLLCDHRPPVCDAVAFLERARRLYPAASRILIAARPGNALLLAAVNRGGVFRVLVRPMSGHRLREAVSAAWQRAQAGRPGVGVPGAATEGETGRFDSSTRV